MKWGELIALVIQNGLPVALKLAEKWKQKDQPVTPEEIAELKELAAKTPVIQMTDALSRAGISPDSEEGKRFLKLVGGYQDPEVAVPAAPPTAPLPEDGA